jgi:hypothetical protein
MQFTVGRAGAGEPHHRERTLIAALTVKAGILARLTYVRPQNRRGDARHPVHQLNEDRA